MSYYQYFKSPIGTLTLMFNEEELEEFKLRKCSKKELGEREELSNSLSKLAIKQLTEYFEGKRKKFDLPLKLEGTEFQKRAWKELCRIPYGETICYGDQAKRMKNEKAQRAVGGANGKNPFPIISPCHRVVAKNGLGGFTGGLPIKKKLLKREGVPL